MITLLPRCCQSVCALTSPSLPPSLLSSLLLFPEPLTDLTKPLHSHQPDPVTCMPPICWRRPGYKLPSEAAARWGRVSQQQLCDEQKKKASPCSCGRRRDLACIDYLLDGNDISVCCVVHLKTTEPIWAFWNFYPSFVLYCQTGFVQLTPWFPLKQIDGWLGKDPWSERKQERGERENVF